MRPVLRDLRRRARAHRRRVRLDSVPSYGAMALGAVRRELRRWRRGLASREGEGAPVGPERALDPRPASLRRRRVAGFSRLPRRRAGAGVEQGGYALSRDRGGNGRRVSRPQARRRGSPSERRAIPVARRERERRHLLDEARRALELPVPEVHRRDRIPGRGPPRKDSLSHDAPRRPGPGPRLASSRTRKRGEVLGLRVPFPPPGRSVALVGRDGFRAS